MVVRELVALLGFKVDPNSEKKANNAIGKIKKGAAILAGIFATGKIAQSINQIVTETAALGDRIDKVSQKLGVGAEALQELRFAAEQTGVSAQQLDVGLQRFIRRAAEAADGSGVAKDALKELGVQLRDNNGNLRPAEQLLSDVADGFAGMGSQADRVKIAFKLFDTEGVALVNTLQNGGEALEAMRERARVLGGILDKDLVRLSAEYTDTQNEMSKALQGVRNVIAKILLPIWIRFSEGVRDLAIEMRGPMRRAIKVIVEIFTAVARILGTVVKGWLAVNKLVVQSAREYLGLNQTLTKTIIVLTALVAILGLPIVLLGLIGAAIFLVIDDLIAMGEGGESVIGSLISEFQRFLEEVGGIGEAIKEILVTALAFWLGASEEQIRKFVDIFLEIVGGVWDAISILWLGDFEKMLEILLGQWRAAARLIKGFFGNNETLKKIETATKGLFGGATAGAASPTVQAATAGGGTSITNAPTTSVNVNVSGATNPEATGAEVSRQLEIVLENDRRKTLQQLAPGSATP